MSRLRFGSSALVCLAIFAMVFSAACASTQSHAVSPMHGSLGSEVVRSYAAYVHASYGETLKGAEALKDAVDAFIKAPSAEGLEAAKARWVSARVPYGKTEVFRFYEGPIDAPARGESPEGPEGRRNAWPIVTPKPRSSGWTTNMP